MVLTEGTNMNQKWLDRITKDLEKLPREGKETSKGKEKEQEDRM